MAISEVFDHVATAARISLKSEFLRMLLLDTVVAEDRKEPSACLLLLAFLLALSASAAAPAATTTPAAATATATPAFAMPSVKQGIPEVSNSAMNLHLHSMLTFVEARLPLRLRRLLPAPHRILLRHLLPRNHHLHPLPHQ